MDESHAVQDHEQPPAGIGLMRVDSQPGRFRKGVMIVVPRLAHRQQSQAADVVPLHRGPVHTPVQFSHMMGEVSHRPVANQGNGDPDADSPHNPRPPAARIQNAGQRQLRCHPVAVQQPVEFRLPHAWFEHKPRRVVKPAGAVQVPEGVSQESALMGVERMAGRLSLRPVADFVHEDDASRASHPHQHARVDHRILQPAWTLEAAVNQQPMQSDGMSKAQRANREHKRHEDRVPARRYRTADDPCDRHRCEPQRAHGRPDHAPSDRVGPVIGLHSLGPLH